MPRTFSRPVSKPAPVEVDGHKFDSAAEARRFGELKLLLRGGVIKDLVVHPRLPMVINGRKIGRGYLLLDFAYDERVDGAWRRIYEDFKGFDTANARTRRAVAEAINDVNIKVTT